MANVPADEAKRQSRNFQMFFFLFSVPPMIWVQNQLISAYEGQQITLECYTEAFPNSINYWTQDGGKIVAQGRNSPASHQSLPSNKLSNKPLYRLQVNFEFK